MLQRKCLLTECLVPVSFYGTQKPYVVSASSDTHILLERELVRSRHLFCPVATGNF